MAYLELHDGPISGLRAVIGQENPGICRTNEASTRARLRKGASRRRGTLSLHVREATSTFSPNPFSSSPTSPPSPAISSLRSPPWFSFPSQESELTPCTIHLVTSCSRGSCRACTHNLPFPCSRHAGSPKNSPRRHPSLGIRDTRPGRDSSTPGVLDIAAVISIPALPSSPPPELAPSLPSPPFSLCSCDCRSAESRRQDERQQWELPVSRPR